MRQTVIFFTVLCIIGFGKPAPRRARTRARREYIWEGPCGRPTLTRAQWVVQAPLVKDSSNSMGIYTSLAERIHGPEDVAFSMPWLLGAWLDAFLGAAALIRVKRGHEVSDIAITSGTVCAQFTAKTTRLQQVVPLAYFALYDMNQRTVRSVPIEACYSNKNNRGTTGDIGILKLGELVAFNSSTSKPVCMPQADEKIKVGTRASVGAWDRNSGELRRIQLQVVDRSACSYDRSYSRSDDTFCVGGYGNDMIGYNNLVSGGPVLTERSDGSYVITGVAAVTMQNIVSPRLPNLVTSVPYYVENGWIEDMIRSKSALWNE